VLKEPKRREIRTAFNLDAATPVADPLGGTHTWKGGYESAAVRYNALNLAREIGAPTTVFVDTNMGKHVLSLADALTVCIAIAEAYQAATLKETDLQAAINTTTTEEELATIVW
jgi:diphthamide biosynthesis methyltransferase